MKTVVYCRFKQYFEQVQLLNVHAFNSVRQTERHTAEPLLHETSSFVVKIATAELKWYKSPGIDQIPAELTQPGGNALRSEIYKLIPCIRNKE
jgi:hypothetical protein